MKIFKFGGASVRNAAGVRNMAEIVGRQEGKLFVVVSAMGKMTNALEAVLEAFYAGSRAEALLRLQAVVDFHNELAAELWGYPYLPEKVGRFYSELEQVVAISEPGAKEYEEWYDRIVGYGELISTAIISEYLSGVGLANSWLDMREYFVTTGRHRDANICIEESTVKLRKTVLDGPQRLFVGQGFIGATAEGVPTTIGREGSDYSAAVAGYILDAQSVTIWKDVPGILNGDPKIFAADELSYIPELTYLDAIELAYSGAQIIHPKTIKPLQNKNIPLWVKCFVDSSLPGSVIKSEIARPIDIPILILKRRQVLVSIRPRDLSFVLEERFGEIFSLLEECRLKVNLIQSSAVSLSVCIDSSRYLEDIIAKLHSRGYHAVYNTDMELLTIRGYTHAQQERFADADNVYMMQRTRHNLRVVRKEVVSD